MGFVKVQDVLKKYENKICIDFLQLTIEKGEIFGLLGPNGAGKSTTINMISGLLPMDRGEIEVDGISVKKKPLEVKKRIGVVPQEIAIYDTLTAKENVTFFARLYGLRGVQLRESVLEALAFVGLLDRQNEKPRSFSGGMKRRLNIACAIMHRPKLLIMDEPTVGIDPQSRNHILDAVKKLKADGTTIIYTSHYMEEVSALCDRIAIMDHGKLIAIGRMDELRRQFAAEERITFTVSTVNDAALSELQRHPKVKSVRVTGNTIDLSLPSAQAYLQDMLYILAKHQVTIHAMSVQEANLESLFLTLTGRSLRD